MNNFKALASKFSFRSWGVFLKWFVLIAAYSFLAYKLITFNQYDRLFAWWRQMPVTQFRWLAAVLVLLPLNWLLEAVKWGMLTSNIQKITLKTSIIAVLAGVSTGFFTPNRVGEVVGRMMYLNAGNRKAGVAMGVLNSLTQNMVMVMCGVPACIVYFSSGASVPELAAETYLMMIGAFLLLFGMLYFSLPKLSRYLVQANLAATVSSFTAGFTAYTRGDLLLIFGVSLLRYFVFCTQFFFMLRFFGIQLQPLEALIAIPVNYLFVTFSPSLAFSEAAVRSSYAVLVIGSYSTQVVNIALAGVCIWAINFVIPMLVGSAVVVGKKSGR